MNDTLYASLFFLIFAVVLVLYGAILARTGNAELLPRRSALSIHSADDVKRVGRIVVVVGLVLGAISALSAIMSSLAG